MLVLVVLAHSFLPLDGAVNVSVVLVGGSAGGVGVGPFIPLLALGDVGRRRWRWWRLWRFMLVLVLVWCWRWWWQHSRWC